MRQGDGSELLGPGDPRNPDIGILHVESRDSRQEILTAISTQELQGRKQIAIVLPEQGKAFRQPVDFDGLKNMRRQLKAQLIFIAPSGPGPAEFARQRRFPVYSSLNTFKSALRNEGIPPVNPRVKTNPGGSRKQSLLPFGPRKPRTGTGPEGPQDTPPTPRLPAAPMSSIPPTPRLQNQPTPAAPPQRSRARVTPPTPPIEDIKTIEIDQTDKPAPGTAGVAAAGMFAAGALGEDDDDMLEAPPAPPSPIAQGSATPTGPASGPARPPTEAPAKTPQEGRAAPEIILFPKATPAATPKITGKIHTIQSPPGRGSGTLPTPPAGGAPAGGVGAANPPAGRNGAVGRLAAPVGAPVLVATAGAVAAPSGASSAGGHWPPPSAGSSPRRGRRRFWRGRTLLLLLLLCLLLAALVVGVFATQGRLPGLPGSLTARVTIMPLSKLEADNYLLAALPTGTPDPARRQIGARLLTQTSGTSSATGNATGSISAQAASGLLTFQNVGGSDVTIGSGVLTGGDGVAVQFSGPIFVPTTGSPTVTGFAVNPGRSGNIAALDIDGRCCAANVFVKNLSAFRGGRDPVPNSVIQQSDIQKAAQPLVNSLTQSTGSALQTQIRPGERAVDQSFQCKSTLHPSVPAGTTAKTVTVSVQVTCREEVYDFAAAESMATSLLQSKAQQDPDLNAQYALQGTVVTGVLNETIVTAQGQVSLEIQAQGRWVYQLTTQLQQNIKNALVGLAQANAQSVLQHEMGVAAATIHLSGGNVLPANASAITLVIQAPPGVQALPTGTAGSHPTVLPGGSAATPTPVNGLGGS
jgi:hypothetical protein